MEKQIKDALFCVAQENPYITQMNIRLLELGEGYAKGSLAVSDAIRNPYGSVHGGCLYSLADITAGFAACTYGQYSSTVNGSMQFLRPAIDVEEIFCEAFVVRQGKSLSVYNVELRGADGTLFETGTFTFFMLNRKVTDKNLPDDGQSVANKHG